MPYDSMNLLSNFIVMEKMFVKKLIHTATLYWCYKIYIQFEHPVAETRLRL